MQQVMNIENLNNGTLLAEYKITGKGGTRMTAVLFRNQEMGFTGGGCPKSPL